MEEIRFLLKNFKSAGIISCGVCANLSGTGGITGIRQMKKILSGEGIKTVFAKDIVFCCSYEIMNQAIKMFKRKISKCDVLIILSCAAGVKSAFLCNPDVSVLSVLDPCGSEVIYRETNGLCSFCGECVIHYTAGICPLEKCPAKSKFGPCKRAPVSAESGNCFMDPEIKCVWSVLGDRADRESLDRLKAEARAKKPRLVPEKRMSSPELIKKTSGRFIAGLRGLSRLTSILK